MISDINDCLFTKHINSNFFSTKSHLILRICIALFTFLSLNLAFAQTVPIKGLRFDPGYVYDDPALAGKSIQQIAAIAAQNAGFNTIFLFAYSPYYGAFYKTTF